MKNSLERFCRQQGILAQTFRDPATQDLNLKPTGRFKVSYFLRQCLLRGFSEQLSQRLSKRLSRAQKVEVPKRNHLKVHLVSIGICYVFSGKACLILRHAKSKLGGFDWNNPLTKPVRFSAGTSSKMNSLKQLNSKKQFFDVFCVLVVFFWDTKPHILQIFSPSNQKMLDPVKTDLLIWIIWLPRLQLTPKDWKSTQAWTNIYIYIFFVASK